MSQIIQETLYNGKRIEIRHPNNEHTVVKRRVREFGNPRHIGKRFKVLISKTWWEVKPGSGDHRAFIEPSIWEVIK